MNIIAVDDEKLSLEALVSAIKENLPNETINAFRKMTDAEVFAGRNGCDIIIEFSELSYYLRKSTLKQL